MHRHRIATGEDPVSSSQRVRGLGLCDALRVELDACQIAGAIDELEERRGPLTEHFAAARTRWDTLTDGERHADADCLEREVSRSAYALEVLTALRGQLPAVDHGAATTLLGPASTVSAIVAQSARNAADDLAELVRESPKTDVRAQARLRDAVTAVNAWVETFIDCEAREWFTFDTSWDPVDRTP